MNPQAGAMAAGDNDGKDTAMTIGQICNREVVSAARDTTVQTAAKLMRHYHVGTVVVVDETDSMRTPVGIVTDRDIVIDVCAVDLNQIRKHVELLHNVRWHGIANPVPAGSVL